MAQPRRILVTGATGYVGGRLIPKLLSAGHDVHILVRDPARAQGRPWSSRVKIHQGDLLKADTLPPAFEGIEAAYYLVHSMAAGSGFVERDRRAAANFALAASQLKHVIYLGGLLPKQGRGSLHLKSRSEVGRTLRDLLPATEFRAGPIIGSGSASFEMLRYLTERLPVMVTPSWVKNQVQPIAIRDVLSYLEGALNLAPAGIVEIGADRLSFREMMATYARKRGYRRLIIPTPVLAPRLAAKWVGLVTPIPNSLAVPIIEGISESLVANTRKAREIFPSIKPLPFHRAVEVALEHVDNQLTETHWSTALGTDRKVTYLKDEEGMIQEVRSIHVNAAPEMVYREFLSLGGERGWLTWDWAWKLRGVMDRALGGPGLRRGRRHPHVAYPGESIDFWRVEAAKFPEMLRLRAEMRVPGRAWLTWEVTSSGREADWFKLHFLLPEVSWVSLIGTAYTLFMDSSLVL